MSLVKILNDKRNEIFQSEYYANIDRAKSLGAILSKYYFFESITEKVDLEDFFTEYIWYPRYSAKTEDDSSRSAKIFATKEGVFFHTKIFIASNHDEIKQLIKDLQVCGADVWKHISHTEEIFYSTKIPINKNDELNQQKKWKPSQNFYL